MIFKTCRNSKTKQTERRYKGEKKECMVAIWLLSTCLLAYLFAMQLLWCFLVVARQLLGLPIPVYILLCFPKCFFIAHFIICQEQNIDLIIKRNSTPLRYHSRPYVRCLFKSLNSTAWPPYFWKQSSFFCLVPLVVQKLHSSPLK